MEVLSSHFTFSITTPKPPLLPRRKLTVRATNTGVGTDSSSPNASHFTTFSASKWADRLLPDFQFLPTSDSSVSASATSSTITSLPPSLAPPDRHLPIPLNFYQVLGAEGHFLGDGIRRAYEAKVSKPPQYGYSQDALVSRRQILQAACETLSDPSSRRDYNLGLSDNVEETILIDVPFDKVPGALCVLQEAGQSELALLFGDSLLKERLPKSIKHDIVLTMALAYVDISRDVMSLTPPDYVQGCESLERALKLLQEEGSSSLAPDLQAQIDETLEEITPRCVLELLALPLNDENRKRRAETLQGVRNILWSVGGGGATAIAGGFTREKFMNEAFVHMTATEQVDLFAATPSNIPAESFEVYGVAVALVAQAFTAKKPHLIQDADNLFQQLQQTKVANLANPSLYTDTGNREMDFALERGLCSLLVGNLDQCRSWLGLDVEDSPYRDPSIVDFILENSKDDDEEDNDTLLGLCKLLETWLMEVVLPRFRETQDVQVKLGDYYDDPKVLRYLESLDGVSGYPLAAAAAIVRIGAGATAVLDTVKISAVQALRKVFPPSGEDSEVDTENGEINISNAAAELLNKSEVNEVSEKEMTERIKDTIIKITCASVVIGLTTFAGLKFVSSGKGVDRRNQVHSVVASDVVDVGLPSNAKTWEITKMDARVAEEVVRKWQNVKSEALGPNHNVERLHQVLDGTMLKIWTDRAKESEERGRFWEYTLLNVTIDSVTMSLDGQYATVEATLEEAASLTDVSHPELNDSYSRTYTTRYEMSCCQSVWKITGGAVLQS
ncbi:uncharacterized protein [Phyllobates terribilis]|uniref:uncharacterized protein n=1 Tax=Phyllobates terribilis TaxID=111132 RepID=UPI003CCA75FE